MIGAKRTLRPDDALLALAGGLVYALAEPPVDFYPGILVGLALLAATFFRAASWRAAFANAFLWALAMQLWTLRPLAAVVQNFTPLGPVVAWLCLPLLAFAQSLPYGIAFGLSHFGARKLGISNIVAFAAGLFLALLSPAVFAWTPAGLLSPYPAILQLAEVVGEHGVSVLLGVAAALFANAALQRSFRPALGGVVILVALLAHGAFRMRQVIDEEAKAPTLKVALLQPGIDAKRRWNRDEYFAIVTELRELTRRAEAEGAQLTIWPEAAYPYRLPHAAGPTPLGERGIVGGGIRGPVLAGLITNGPGDSRYNAATVVAPNGRMQLPQAKMDLLWFGETVPFGDTFPWLRRTFQPRGALLPGKDVRLLHAHDARMAVLNCYEDTLPGRGRAMAALSPNLLVNVTNDAWFVPSAEPEIHLRLSVMRAIELRRSLVRAVNMGPSSWIDAAGRVRARHVGDEPGFVMATPALHEGPPTLFARFGHVPMTSALFLWAGVEAIAYRQRRRALSSARS